MTKAVLRQEAVANECLGRTRKNPTDQPMELSSVCCEVATEMASRG